MNTLMNFMFNRMMFLGLSVLLCNVAFSGPAGHEVDRLLSQPMTIDASREKAIEGLVALGIEGSWAMAERLSTQDLFKYMTLREALIQLDATASPALKHFVDLPPENRARAAMSVLAKIGNPDDLEFLMDHASDSRWWMRASSLRAVGKTGVIAATVEQHLITALNDPDSSVRRYALGALGTVGTLHSYPILLERLSDESFFVRRAAKRAITKLWERNAESEIDLNPVIRLAQNDSDFPAQLLAMELLGTRKEQSAFLTLKNLSTDKDYAVQAAALRALQNRHSDWIKTEFNEVKDFDPLVQGILDEIKD